MNKGVMESVEDEKEECTELKKKNQIVRADLDSKDPQIQSRPKTITSVKYSGQGKLSGKQFSASSCSSLLRDKSKHVGDYPIIYAPTATEIMTNEGIELCNGKKHKPYPANPDSIGAQSMMCGHAEIGLVNHLSKNSALKGKMVFNIDWSKGPYPCIFCARTLCELMDSCDIELIFCNKNDKQVSFSKNADKEKCDSIKESTNSRGNKANSCKGYQDFIKKIDGIVIRTTRGAK